MTREEFDRATEQLLTLAEEVANSKRPDYTQGSEDVLRNFKEAGRDAKISPEAACLVYMRKHWDAIVTIMIDPDRKYSEAPPLRFADLINYLKLAFALYLEREKYRQQLLSSSSSSSSASSPE